MHTPIKRALLSVSNKDGLAGFAERLVDRGIEVLSTGGTAAALEAAGIAVTPVEDITRFPEMLGGRVKTLHPMIHGGLLGVRGDRSHESQMARHGIERIDLLVVDLYPFEATIAKPGVTRDDAIEQIDIGGPAMIRSAAKNHASVAVVTDPRDYDRVLDDMDRHAGATSDTLRRELAAKAFARTAAYDAAITGYLSGRDALPDRIVISLERSGELRYGENPHQPAAVYRHTGSAAAGVLGAEQLHGKPLSFNNIADASAAWALVTALDRAEPGRAGAVIVKHANPCGVAVAGDAFTAVDGAFAGDPVAAFGGILACNSEIGSRAAERLCEEGVFLEVIAAAGFEAAAVEQLRDRWKNLRLLQIGIEAETASTPRRRVRHIAGGALVQMPDAAGLDRDVWRLSAGPEPTGEHGRVAGVLECALLALASNAVAIGGTDPDRPGCVRLFGAGAGQMDRVTACRIASEKAGALTKGAVCFSDAFFPFDDGPRVLIEAGVRAIYHPGGSKRDGDTFRLCEEHGVSCVLTGVRHFSHEPLS